MANDEERIDSLLAGGGLGGPSRERVLERVLDGLAAPPLRTTWWQRVVRSRFVVWAPAVAAIGMLLTLWVPSSSFTSFTAKGVDALTVPLVEIACEDGNKATCAVGQKLIFTATAAPEGGFVSAWAEPAAGGERVWYFPDGQDRALALEPMLALQVGKQAVLLGAQQPPGEYRVTVVVSARPLSRAEVLSRATDPSPSTRVLSLTVTQ